MTNGTPKSREVRSEELRSLRESIQAQGLLWAWGTEETLIPWEDRHGRTMLVFWKSEARALEENEEDAEPEEKPLPYSVARLLEKLDYWEDAGVTVIGLEPRGARILYSLEPAEFRALLQGDFPSRHLP